MPTRKSKKSKQSRGRTILPKPLKGALEDYSTKKPKMIRHRSLDRQAAKKGVAPVIRELNLRAVMNKRNVEVAKKMRDDMLYLRKSHQMKVGSRQSRKSKHSKRSKRNTRKSRKH